MSNKIKEFLQQYQKYILQEKRCNRDEQHHGLQNKEACREIVCR